MRFLLCVILLMAVLIPAGMAADNERPFEAGIYVSIYSMDSARWAMTPANAQYEAYRNTDLDAILTRMKNDGFDLIYMLPGDWLGKGVLWKTNLPFLRTKQEWIEAKRDLMEELLSAADKNHQKLVFTSFGLENDPTWWRQQFPKENWYDDKARFTSQFLDTAYKASIPAMQEVVANYGNHPSFVGLGTDEVCYSGDCFKTGISESAVGFEARALYKKRTGEEPPSLEPFPDKVNEKVSLLLDCREDVLVNYHRVLANACQKLGKEYTTTLNSTMLNKMRWEGLGGERAVFGSDPWRTANLPGVSEVALDFYATMLGSHIQSDLTKFITSPLYNKPVNLVIGTEYGPDILAKHLLDTMAEGVDRITYWTNYYYYGDTPNTKVMYAPADPDRISYLVKATKEFRKQVPVKPDYDVAIVLNRKWQRNHYKSTDLNLNEIAQMSYVVDALNMAGYRYDIQSDDEAAAGGIAKIPAVIVPLGLSISESTLSAFEKYIQQGGLLIVNDRLGSLTICDDSVSASMKQRVGHLLHSKNVVTLSQLPGQWSSSRVLAEILSRHGIKALSPLVKDNVNLKMADEKYDPYWAPKPKFDVNGKVYDLFWSGDRYQAISVGNRSNLEGKFYQIGRFSAKLKPFQNLVVGKSSSNCKDYDLLLVNNKQEINVRASKVLVFGKDGQWSQREVDSGKSTVTLQGPALVKIP